VELASINLTSEGICNSPSDIILMSTAQTPANSYKKDNSDLLPDDKPFIYFVTKNGKYSHILLSVIDRAQGLSAWRNKNKNDTRYVTAEQTANFRKNVNSDEHEERPVLNETRR